ncbi:PREDICTED: uncharacterized protein LOC108781969 isoform X2 [Cyphomyrmex costatus]|uniref:uncharacterized protein LOC108781969 isoform X2 n=1 Tax=Cyphomyrmex costatus TaxID=456900 RepID=UPI0008521F63|nr:PREDICTED: uncharacterized protein LOC108781969 isoform X2 [Cyphomyrmex costatus]
MRKKFSRGSLFDYRIMVFERCALLPAIVIVICLDVSSIAATAAAVAWNPKTSRYMGSYNLDKGPVFYEAYYPNTRDAEDKRYFDQNTVLETSFQVPFEGIAQSETANHPVTINESFVIVDNEILPRNQWKLMGSRRNYDPANQLASLSNERSMITDDKNSQVANIEKISKLIRRAISRDLENWNTLEEYLDRTVHRPQAPQLEINKNEEGGNYMFPVNRKFVEMDSSKRSSFEASSPRKLDVRNAKEQPTYFEEVDTSGSTSGMSISGTKAAVAADIRPPIDISDSLPPENIFQPRPQLVKYTFFKRPMSSRLDEQNEKPVKPIEQSTPRTYGDNLIREEITDNNRDKIRENVKVTSIEISEQPRHKTRHHHGEFPYRHRSQSAAYPTVS